MPMPQPKRSARELKTVRRFAGIVVLLLVTTSCSALELGSPVAASNRPLAEQLEDRRAAQDALATVDTSPDALAFTETWESGTFLRLDIREGDNVVLRSGPSDSFDEISLIEPGAEVLATGNQTGEWIHVLYAAFDGWVRSDLIAIGPIDVETQVVDIEEVEATTISYEVFGDIIGVNIRATPNVSGDAVGGSPVGSRLEGTGQTEGSWIEVRFDGGTGWVSGLHLRPVS